MSDDPKVTRLSDARKQRRTAPPGGGGPAGSNPFLIVPKDWPIMALGYDCRDKGPKRLHMIDAKGNLRSLSTDKLTRNTIASLFPPAYLQQWFPRFPKGWNGPWDLPVDPPPDSFKAEVVSDRLIGLCTDAGVIDLDAALRGRGIWVDEDDELVVNLGNVLEVRGREMPVGRRSNDANARIYLKGPALMPPASTEQATALPARQLFELFKQLSFVKPDFAARIMVGTVGCQFLCGALEHRPHTLVTAPQGSGKTLLQTIDKFLLGNWLLLLEDTTAAGIYQQLERDALPVALDEWEARGREDGGQRNADTLRLMRAAFSGGSMARGGQDGKASVTTLRCTFLNTGVNQPPMQPQDRSRAARLEMLKVEQPGPIEISPTGLQTIGQAMLRRLISGWPRLRHIIDGHRRALGELKFNARLSDTYATLLGCAWLLLEDDEVGPDCLDAWKTELLEELETHRGEEQEPYRTCLDMLLQSPVELARKAETPIVAGLLMQATGWAEYGQTEHGDQITRRAKRSQVEAASLARTRSEASQARELLSKSGFRLVVPGKTTREDIAAGDPDACLAVSCSSKAIGKLLVGSEFAGGWATQLLRAPGAQISRTTRFAGVMQRAVLVPLQVIWQGLPIDVEEGET